MQKSFKFEDGTCVNWLDRQTVEYSKDGRTLLVWIDFDNGWSIGKRVIKTESLDQWTKLPQGFHDYKISEIDKKHIIDSVRRFFSLNNIECRLE